jgi:hypothetical protein
MVRRIARYAGGHRRVPLRLRSRSDPRDDARMARKLVMRGGDRRKYATCYADVIAERFPLREDRTVGGRRVIVELGVLRGHGLAALCDLFPESRVVGLDVDISHFQEFQGELAARGAFRGCSPEVHEFDEMAEDRGEKLRQILGDDKIDVFIDDAIHRASVMRGVFASAEPLLAPGYLYFLEDNGAVARMFDAEYDVTVFERRLVVVRGRGGEHG